MAESLPEWMVYPEVGSPEAAMSHAATTGEPMWKAYPEAPAEPEAPQTVPMLKEHPLEAAISEPLFRNREEGTRGQSVARAALPLMLGGAFGPPGVALADRAVAALNPKWAENVAREEASGATLGLSDKALAAGGATLDQLNGAPEGWADAYHKTLEHIRDQSRTFADTNPAASWGSWGVGTLGGTALTPAARAATTLGKIAAGGATGAGVGAVSGFSHTNDESLGQDLAATGIGTAIGAPIGAGGAAIGDRVVAPVVNWVARKFSPEAADSQAVKVIADRMRQDANAGGPSANDMLDLLTAAGAERKPQTLADVAGENVKGLTGRIAREPGEGKQIIAKALNERDVGAGSRLAEDVNAGISGGGSAHDTIEAMMQARSAAAQPRYAEAFQRQQVWSPRLQEFLEDPVMRQGLRRGMELERIDSVTHRRPFDPTTLGVDLDQEGNVALRTVPNMRVLDAGKRGLDAMIADERNPMTGRLSQRGVTLDQFRRGYLGELDDLDTSGNYAAARQSWAGPSASMDAVRAGQAILQKNPEEIAAEVDRLHPGDQEFYRLGAADAIKEKLARTGMGGDESKRIIGNEFTQRQIRPLFQSQKEYDRFINGVTAENRMFETRHNTLGGSHTAGRAAEDSPGGGAALGHAVRGGLALSEGAPGAATLSFAKALGALSRGESPAVNAAAARILTEPATSPTLYSNLVRLLAAQQPKGQTPMASTPLASVLASSYPQLTSLPYLPQSTR